MVKRIIVASLVVLAGAFAPDSFAQASPAQAAAPIKRVIVQRSDIPGTTSDRGAS